MHGLSQGRADICSSIAVAVRKTPFQAMWQATSAESGDNLLERCAEFALLPLADLGAG